MDTTESLKSNFDKRGFLFVTKFFVFTFLIIFVIHTGADVIADSLYGVEYDLAPVEEMRVRLIRERELERIAENLRFKIPDIRTIKEPFVEKYIPQEGRFVGVNLSQMKVTLFEDGEELKKLDVISKGKPGSLWETPSGFYTILTKEINHFSSIGEVYMPYSMQFFGNFFIHGWPKYPSGVPVEKGFSGGCIRLTTKDSKEVFDFIEKGGEIFIYDEKLNNHLTKINLKEFPVPEISAKTFLVADINSGMVFLEHGKNTQRPIASITKLMTAIVANETISFNKVITISGLSNYLEGDRGFLIEGEKLVIGDAFFPLIMESNNTVASSIASFYGKENFIKWMNKKAEALDMRNSNFDDASGISSENVSTIDDLFLLVKYLYNKKSFVLDISKKPEKEIYSPSGRRLVFRNFNHFSGDDNFIGGKTGFTNAAKETMVSLFSVGQAEQKSPIAIIVLGSENREKDTRELLSWFKKASGLQF